jgi:hypothetical protein
MICVAGLSSNLKDEEIRTANWAAAVRGAPDHPALAARPHFLFNTLNSISAYVECACQTRLMLEQLGTCCVFRSSTPTSGRSRSS